MRFIANTLIPAYPAAARVEQLCLKLDMFESPIHVEGGDMGLPKGHNCMLGMIQPNINDVIHYGTVWCSTKYTRMM